MNLEEFQKHAHKMVDWMVDYYKNIEEKPVKSGVSPGEILQQLPDSPPQAGEGMDDILEDFQNIIMPGITHWQNPKFFAYFPANASYPSLLAEMLTATLATQCMIWDTSPSAAELEEQMMNWLKEMTGLPAEWSGVIQDGASNATLTALLTAREMKTSFRINKEGYRADDRLKVYCSTETHSSIEKAVKIAGMGKNCLVKTPVDNDLAMDPEALENAILDDLGNGFQPLCVIIALGTTGTTAIDPLAPVAAICKKYGLWLHVDAAYSGTALILPEYRWMIEGIEDVDSFVFNPHKWMFTHFDCTAYFVKDKEALVRTFEILPEYLKTQSRGKVNDYRDWGIPMGRRFRALKLWFVIRNFGLDGLQKRIREHITLATDFESWVIQHPDFEIMAKRSMNLVCFRYHPAGENNQHKLDELNESLLNRLNGSGKLFLTHTKVNNKYTLRMVIGQTYVERRHIEEAWDDIVSFSN
ncbi:MAG: aminotransferase class I/II-fold pyridoxal phosphate-dependent enzyme [Bacteroidetes bacterium]|nr:aminotransferase class I/II-fold pyridoxal phosphate-dependent enzyme [Bacteroidota bacterium]MBT3748606.1 aminotransferase class I/II-fold pyridoxal phosphate-dependent enzyme [Bacteroidota bacterium]MBT4400100.1 aminotransferase class I/II-fold pyridoxal phosphate-dependent enzyme [Bacteroidota bacterium]MBT4411409.1 aminotransferase class I/II-fold pyridoxal phosphate-dependent enzyme [Bacteroidota bacterium]MBT5427641.1 aminotransferase class I/II-fold pyridoxal phosphate-dependent enzym